MRIKNQKQLSIETLKKQLEKTLPQYHYEIHKKTVTAIKDEKAKMNIVQMDDEFWMVEAVPFHFKLVVVIVLISIFAYWVQLQGWYWMINVGLYLIAFIILGYVANWFYGWMYAKDFKDFKPKLMNTLKKLLE